MTRRGLLTVTLGSVLMLPACWHREAAAPPETPTLDVTNWTDKTELFMEYPPLVAGQSAKIAVHLTEMAQFKALTVGKPKIEFTPAAGGPPTVLIGNEPSRPGVFRVEGAPPAAGQYRWALIVETPADRHDLGTVTVFADEKSAVADAEKQQHDDPTAIPYLKEQQWTNPFATDKVQERELRTAIRVPAVLAAVTGGESVVAAPAAGRFTAETLVRIGAAVAAGQELGRLEPRLASGQDRATLAADVAEAKAALDAATAEQARADRLLAERAVPARRVEDARRATSVAETRLRAAEARLAQRDETLHNGGSTASGNAFVLKAPLSGRIAQVLATLGASYDEGAPLFKIVRTDRLELSAQVPVSDAPAARAANAVELEIAGRPDPFPVRPLHVHDAGVIDPATRALPVQFEIDNPQGQLLIGQHVTALLYTRERVRGPAVPKAAVLMESGRPYVFVHASGESFTRRYIEISARDGDWIGVKTGLRTGDRVVIRGSYDVQLASAAKGLAGEGHVH